MNMGTKRTCENCRFHEEYTWVCFNGYSRYCCEVTNNDETCDDWKDKEYEYGKDESYGS